MRFFCCFCLSFTLVYCKKTNETLQESPLHENGENPLTFTEMKISEANQEICPHTGLVINTNNDVSASQKNQLHVCNIETQNDYSSSESALSLDNQLVSARKADHPNYGTVHPIGNQGDLHIVWCALEDGDEKATLNQIFNHLSKMKRLKIDIESDNCQYLIEYLYPRESLNLHLDIPEGEYADLKILSLLPNLKDLSLSISGLGVAYNLDTLNQLTSLTLRRVHFSPNEVYSLSNLTKLHIYDVDLGSQQLEFTNLSQSLTEISLSNCKITNLSGIEALTNLKKVEFFANYINDISSIYNLATLETASFNDQPQPNPMQLIELINKYPNLNLQFERPKRTLAISASESD